MGLLPFSAASLGALLVFVAWAAAARYWPRKLAGPTVWAIEAELPHRAPATPFTADKALAAANEHRRCRPEDCARKRAALRVLITGNRIEMTEHLYEVLYMRFVSEID